MKFQLIIIYLSLAAGLVTVWYLFAATSELLPVLLLLLLELEFMCGRLVYGAKLRTRRGNIKWQSVFSFQIVKRKDTDNHAFVTSQENISFFFYCYRIRLIQDYIYKEG